MLTITVPVAPEARATRVDIKAASLFKTKSRP